VWWQLRRTWRKEKVRGKIERRREKAIREKGGGRKEKRDTKRKTEGMWRERRGCRKGMTGRGRGKERSDKRKFFGRLHGKRKEK